MGKNNLVAIYGTNEKGNRLCKECLIYKEESNFYKNPNYPQGLTYLCKPCFNKHKKKTKLEKQQSRDRKNDLKNIPDTGMAKMTQCSKQDYKMMYEFLNTIGYDPKQDIAKQFADKWKVTYKKRERKDENLYNSEGKKNPLHRTWKGDE